MILAPWLSQLSGQKSAALEPSNSSALLLLKPSTPSDQNPGTLLPMNSKTRVPPLNLGTPSQHTAGTMKHVTPLHSKPGALSQPKLDHTPSLGYSHHIHPKICHGPGLESLHFRSPNTHHTSDHQGFLLPTPQIICHTLDLGSSYPRSLKSHHFLNLLSNLSKFPQAYHFPNVGLQSPINSTPHILQTCQSQAPTSSEPKHIPKHNLKSYNSQK